MPLPDLDQQRDVVARIDRLQTRLHDGLQLRLIADELAREARVAMVDAEADKLPFDGVLADILTEKPRNGWSPVCDNMDGGTPVLALGAVTGFRYRATAFKRTGAPTEPGAHYWLAPGDLIITRSNTPELVGHAAIYSGEPHPCIYPDLMMRLRVDRAVALPKFVHWMLQTRTVRRYLMANASGTSPTMRKINQGTVMSTPFPTRVPLGEQKRVVDRLDRLTSALEAAAQQAEATRADLEALGRAVLTKAFEPSGARSTRTAHPAAPATADVARFRSVAT